MSLVELSNNAPLFVVFNARSGERDARSIHEALTRVLATSARRYELFAVDDPSKLAAIAQRAARLATDEQGAVVVAGGDGTINCVAHAVLPTGRPLGILPKGTFNYTSRAHGLPLDPESAARVLIKPQFKPVQVGSVNDRIFLVNASVGLYPQLQEEREHFKRRYGRKRWVAAWAALSTLLHQHTDLTLELSHDGERQVLRASTLFVGNNALQLQRVGVSAADALERHQLAALLGEPAGRVARFGVALLAARGQLERSRHVQSFSFERMTVRPVSRTKSRTLKVSVDGEICRLPTPLVWSVAPRPLLLMTA